MAGPRAEMLSDFLGLIRDGCSYVAHRAKTLTIAIPLIVVGFVWAGLVVSDITWIGLIAPLIIVLSVLGLLERGRAETEQERRAENERLRREQDGEEERERQKQLAALEAERAEKDRLLALKQPRERLVRCLAWRRDELQLAEWLREEEEAYAKNAADRELEQKRRSLLLALDRDLELA